MDLLHVWQGRLRTVILGYGAASMAGWVAAKGEVAPVLDRWSSKREMVLGKSKAVVRLQ